MAAALHARHGYEVPEAVVEAGLDEPFDDAMARSARCTTRSCEPFPEQAAYAVSLAYRVRFAMQMNAREAMHLLELRTAPPGHPAYRRVVPGDAPADRGAGRPPRDRGGDDATSTTPPTSSSGSPPSAPPTPAVRAGPV